MLSACWAHSSVQSEIDIGKTEAIIAGEVYTLRLYYVEGFQTKSGYILSATDKEGKVRYRTGIDRGGSLPDSAEVLIVNDSTIEIRSLVIAYDDRASRDTLIFQPKWRWRPSIF